MSQLEVHQPLAIAASPQRLPHSFSAQKLSIALCYVQLEDAHNPTDQQQVEKYEFLVITLVISLFGALHS
jgi:hypothetical protein